MAAMVSASRDGALLAGILERFGVQPVRGSSAAGAARKRCCEIISWAERGYDLAITPDGPRGPCYIVQEGVMSLAQVTGLPIVPVAINLNWKICAEKLGPVSNSAAVRALRSRRRPGHARAARSNGRRTRSAAPTA